MSTPVARRLTIVLAVSVGLNLFLGGMITSAWITRHAGPGRPPVAGLAGPFDFRGGIQALGRDARPMASGIRRDYGPRLREAGRDMRAARRAVAEMLRGDELDPAALQAALRDLRQASDAAQAAMHEVLIETMTRLDAEQRRAFLEAGMRRSRHDRPRPPGDRRP